jgi:hypothetical protein
VLLARSASLLGIGCCLGRRGTRYPSFSLTYVTAVSPSGSTTRVYSDSAVANSDSFVYSFVLVSFLSLTAKEYIDRTRKQRKHCV